MRGTRRFRWEAILAMHAFAAALWILMGCSKDDLVDTPRATTFFGTFTGSAGSAGTIELAGFSAQRSGGAALSPGANPISIAGQLRIAGQPAIAISGLYDSSGGQVTFADENGDYSCAGQVTAGQAAGFCTGPSSTTGTFVLFLGGTSASVLVYCGDAVCDTPSGCTTTGTFNLAVSDGSALLSATLDGATSLGSGTVTGTDVDFHITEPGQDLTIHGVITGNDVVGDWADNDPNAPKSGFWQGSTGACTTAASHRSGSIR